MFIVVVLSNAEVLNLMEKQTFSNWHVLKLSPCPGNEYKSVICARASQRLSLFPIDTFTLAIMLFSAVAKPTESIWRCE